MKRRSFLAAMLAACAAPAYVKAGVLMPVRKIIVPRVFPMEIGRYDGFRFIESPMLQTWGDNLHDGDDYREWQRVRNVFARNLMDNAYLAANPSVVIGHRHL